MRKIAAAMLAGMLTATTARAEFSASGNEMLPICKAFYTANESRRELLVKSAICLGQVTGISSTLHYLEIVCLPKGATADQIFRVVLTYLENHPERLHEHFTILAIEGLRGTWPCPGR